MLLISDDSLAFLSDIEMILEDLSHDIVLPSLLWVDAKASEDFFKTNLLLLLFVYNYIISAFSFPSPKPPIYLSLIAFRFMA